MSGQEKRPTFFDAGIAYNKKHWGERGAVAELTEILAELSAEDFERFLALAKKQNGHSG